MKKYLNFALVLFAGLTVALSCAKQETNLDNPGLEQGQEVTEGRIITISATLSDALTKVIYEAEYDGDNKPTAVKHTWENTDQLYVWSQDHSQSAILDLVSGDGTNSATFSGPVNFTDASYDLEVASTAPADYASQAQACDGDLGHIVFIAGKTGVTDLTAPVTLDETSGILAVIAQLPAGVAETIESLEIASVDGSAVFGTSPTLTVAIGTGDVDSDNILKIYANVPSGWTINSGTELFLRFNAPSSAHTVYTRYYKAAADKPLGDGKFTWLKLNCSQTDKHAGPATADGSTAEKAYLIADKYQLAAINSYASTSATTYFKLIDNIDMFGITHNPINTGIPGYTINVNFDGNAKTISNLGTSLFYVFKGFIKDLTLDNCSVSKRGIFAEYCQGTGHTISNVKITNGTVNSSTSNVGSLIGRINNGSDGVTSVTITDCNISDTDVKGSGTVGGMIGQADAIINVSRCDISGGTVTSAGQFCGGLIGNARNYASTFTDCHVSSITVTSSADRVGGLAGQTEKLTAVNNCSSTNAIVTGTINLGGLLGILYGSATDCTSTGGSITSTNTTSNTDIGLGGLAGWLQYGIISHCSSSVSINQTSNGRDIGGLVGKMVDGTIENSYATGNVKGIQRNVGGLVGLVTLSSGDAIISDCYSTGSVEANAYGGGLLGYHEKGNLTVTNCYSTGAVTGTGGFAMGGLIGIANNVAVNVSKCVAWNPSVSAASIGPENWSSAAVVGVVHPNCTLTDNYRNPSMAITAYWGNQPGYTVGLAAGYSQPNVSGTTHPLTDSNGDEMTDTGTANNAANPHYPIFPYHGKVEAGKTLCDLAENTLGWSDTIWDFSGALPTLK